MHCIENNNNGEEESWSNKLINGKREVKIINRNKTSERLLMNWEIIVSTEGKYQTVEIKHTTTNDVKSKQKKGMVNIEFCHGDEWRVLNLCKRY